MAIFGPPDPYLPVTYRRDPVGLVGDGRTVGLSRFGRAPAGAGAYGGRVFQPPGFLTEGPLTWPGRAAAAIWNRPSLPQRAFTAAAPYIAGAGPWAQRTAGDLTSWEWWNSPVSVGGVDMPAQVSQWPAWAGVAGASLAGQIGGGMEGAPATRVPGVGSASGGLPVGRYPAGIASEEERRRVMEQGANYPPGWAQWSGEQRPGVPQGPPGTGSFIGAGGTQFRGEPGQRRDPRGTVGGPATGAGPVTQGGTRWRDPPEGVDRNWYHAFQREHDGQTPEEFYRGKPLNQLSYAERDKGLDEALFDRRWSEGFARMNNGQPPTEDDWKAHWHASRPGMQRPWWEGMNPARVARIGAQRRKWRMQRRREREGDTYKQYPPNYEPPVTYWRYTQ